MNQRELFLRHLAQTSPAPLALEIVKAEGCQLFDAAGRSYIDLIGGISVANTGHRHPAVVDAIHRQLDAYMHVMVYGEFVESPQVQYATLLAAHLPDSLNAIYFTNSGAEAVEGAMKLAKRVTGRSGILACNQSYHGSTQGALSIIGDEYWRNAFRPLLPGVLHADYNTDAFLKDITTDTACVIVETVQAERGVVKPDPQWMKALRARCIETGALLVLDEIQAGFGRTGTLWGFEQYEIVPDILLLGKALGGGMPLGAFVADKKLMDRFTDNPVLGHITTFGGHPVCCAAGKAAMDVLLADHKAVIRESLLRANQLDERLQALKSRYPVIKAIRGAGLWFAVEFDSFDTCKRVIDYCIASGVLTDWFLFAPQCLRISPPLTITEAELKKACTVLAEALQSLG